MCILFWTVDNHPKYKFVFAGNRDEFLKRPTARAHFWEPPYSNVLAGTDLEKHENDENLRNGTWLGITREGRFSALTNYRERNFQGTISRGVLVRDFLCGTESVFDYVQQLEMQENSYGGFSLVNFDFSKDNVEMAYISNREEHPIIQLKSGEIYGLSNSILTKPWPKVEAGKQVFERIMQQQDIDEAGMISALFGLLSITKPMNNTQDMAQIFDDLKERISIPLFEFPEQHGLKELFYATRSSTVVLIDKEDNVTFVERMWYNEQSLTPEKDYKDKIFHFKIEKSSPAVSGK